MATDKQRELVERLTLSAAFDQVDVDHVLEHIDGWDAEEVSGCIEWLLDKLARHEKRKKDSKARKKAWRQTLR